jgi:16S rRNA (uracil1498-N3)-methyltransferase
MSRHFRVAGALVPGAPVDLDADRFVRVLRRQVGDEVILCDATGTRGLARIVSLSPCVAEVLQILPDPGADATTQLTVWLPLLKGGRSDDLVRQLVELGVTAIQPFQSRHSVVQLDARKGAERRTRFAAIANEASNQCGRLHVPTIAEPVHKLPLAGPGIFFWEAGGRPLAELSSWCDGHADHPTSILFGPEGGLAPTEAEHLQQHGWTAFSLGPRILRAETAVVAGVTLVQAALGALEPRT